MNRTLFHGETETGSWGTLTLTSHRVIHVDEHQGTMASTSLLLAGVEWTRLAREHKPYLMMLGIAAGLLAAYAGVLKFKEGVLIFGVSAVAALIAYLLSRRVTMTIGAGQGRIEMVIEGGGHQRRLAREALDAVEYAATVARSRSTQSAHQDTRVVSR